MKIQSQRAIIEKNAIQIVQVCRIAKFYYFQIETNASVEAWLNLSMQLSSHSITKVVKQKLLYKFKGIKLTENFFKYFWVLPILEDFTMKSSESKSIISLTLFIQQ